MKNWYCFACCKDLKGAEIENYNPEDQNLRTKLSDPIINTEGQEECVLLTSQLPAIFLIRKFVELPKEVCLEFLENYGNPCSWIKWCSSCSILIEKAKSLFNKISTLKRQTNKLRNELRDIIINSDHIKTNDDKIPSITDTVRSYLLNGELKSNKSPVHVKIENSLHLEEDYDPSCDDIGCDVGDYSSCTDSDEDKKDFSSLIKQPNSLLPRNRSRAKPRNVEKNRKISTLQDENVNENTVDADMYLSSNNSESLDNSGFSDSEGFNENDIKVECAASLIEKVNKEGAAEGEVIGCPQCHKQFKHINSLQKHLKFHVANRPYGCKVCKKRFIKIKDLNDHKVTHTEKRPFRCESCGKSFRQICSLYRHRKQEQCGILHECTTCNEKFNQLGALRRHCSNVHGATSATLDKTLVLPPRKSVLKKPCQCTVCGITLSRLQDLKRHMLVHTGERPFSCKICNRRFKQSGEVTVHMRIHTDERPYNCTTCGKTFKSQTVLTVHSKIHIEGGKERKYLCTICGRAVVDSYRLKLHIMNHTGEKPHPCTYCDVRFTTKQKLARHIMTHTGEKPFLCTNCGKGFPTLEQLRSHERRIHIGVKPHVCASCGKAFADRSNLKKHMRVHEHGVRKSK